MEFIKQSSSNLKQEQIEDSIFNYSVINSKGEEISLENYRSKALVLANISVKDGNAIQYLKKIFMIYGSFKHRGLKVLVFPCGQFGEKESHAEVVQFLNDNNMDIGEVMAPINVNGSKTSKLFKFLKRSAPGPSGDFIQNNFTLFIVDENGKPIERFTPPYSSDLLKDSVDTALKEKERYESLFGNLPSVV